MNRRLHDARGDYEITFSPTDMQFADVERWLASESKEMDSGFYCNWNVIQSSFHKNELAIALWDGLTVGFATWTISTDKTARIEIEEIKPSHRGRGIGKRLTHDLLDHLATKGIFVVDLECAPSESEQFWKNVGFLEFPDPPEKYKYGFTSNKRLYTIIVDNLRESNTVGDSDEMIELWNDESYRIKPGMLPTYVWQLEFVGTTRNLPKPIIHPAGKDWHIRWMRHGETIFEGKVKRLTSDGVNFDSFVIVESLPLL